MDVARVSTGEMGFLPGFGLDPSTGEMDVEFAEAASMEVVNAFVGVEDHPILREAEIVRLFVGSDHPVLGRQSTSNLLATDIALSTLQWKMENVEKILVAAGRSRQGLFRSLPGGRRAAQIKLLGRRIARMYVAYSHSGPASLALGQAVQRQATFVARIKELGWLEPGRWDGGVDGQGKGVFLLQRSAARYRESVVLGLGGVW
jgi:hypothetical protein